MATHMAGAFSPLAEPFTFRAQEALGALGSAETFQAENDKISFHSQREKPFIDEKTGVACMFSGNIWNLSQIRRELVLRGHEDCCTTPEQVLCRAYSHWGKSCFIQFRGSFAIALYDPIENALVLARDRFGICTLFYGNMQGCFGFSSRIKGLLTGGFSPKVDEEGLLDILSIGPGRSPGSGIFRDIFEVEPAQVMTLGAAGIDSEYFYLPKCEPKSIRPRQAAQDIYDLLFASVRRSIEDKRVCSMLSGGLDSSSISAIASRLQGGLLSFSIDYEGHKESFQPSMYQPNTDADFVHIAAKAVGSMHENIMLSRNELLESLRPAMQARDLPGMGSVDGSLLLFCGKLSNWADAALSGECADEFFLGYPWFHRDELLNRNTFPFSDSAALRKSILSENLTGAPIEDYTQAIYQKELAGLPEYNGESERDTKVRQAAWLTSRIFMQNLMERAVRMGEAAGIEILVPFCDEELYDYLWNLPHAIKCAGNSEKGILRMAMGYTLPNQLVYRKKSPFPKTHDPVYGEMVFTALDEILATDTPVHQVFEGKALAEAAREGTQPWFGQLMSGVQLAEYAIQMHYWLTDYDVDFTL